MEQTAFPTDLDPTKDARSAAERWAWRGGILLMCILVTRSFLALASFLKGPIGVAFDSAYGVKTPYELSEVAFLTLAWIIAALGLIAYFYKVKSIKRGAA